MSHIIRHNKCGRHDNARLLCARSSRGTRELQRCRGFRKSRAVYLRRMRCTLRRSNWLVRLCISSVCHIHLYYICGNCTLEIIFNRFVSLWLYSKRYAKEISFVFDLVIGLQNMIRLAYLEHTIQILVYIHDCGDAAANIFAICPPINIVYLYDISYDYNAVNIWLYSWSHTLKLLLDNTKLIT